MVLCAFNSLLLVKRWTIWVQSNTDSGNGSFGLLISHGCACGCHLPFRLRGSCARTWCIANKQRHWSAAAGPFAPKISQSKTLVLLLVPLCVIVMCVSQSMDQAGWVCVFSSLHVHISNKEQQITFGDYFNFLTYIYI